MFLCSTLETIVISTLSRDLNGPIRSGHGVFLSTENQIRPFPSVSWSFTLPAGPIRVLISFPAITDRAQVLSFATAVNRRQYFSDSARSKTALSRNSHPSSRGQSFTTVAGTRIRVRRNGRITSEFIARAVGV